ncbi:MAG: NitT/TauT family transport system substrate-binding protein [Chloroflexota bacterium]|nr:NitT/TauT family transport system substrate-binding protein [Chloroflexota bacterium]
MVNHIDRPSLARSRPAKARISRLNAALVALLLVALTAGCQAPRASNAAPIKLALSAWPGWFPWYIAEEKGYFKEEGVPVELVWFPVYSDSIQALSAGQVDANSQTLGDTLGPLAEGVPLSIVLVNDNSAGNDAVIAKPEIQSLTDLRGKTVATELGAVDHFLLLMALDRVGMKESDINFVNMAVNDAAPALIAGQLDAVAVWEPFLSQIKTSGKGKVLFDSSQAPGIIPDLLVMKSDVVKNRPDDVKKILRAWYRSLDFIQQNPTEAMTIMAKHADTSLAEYRDFAHGTKLFSLDDNLTAFAPDKGDASLSVVSPKIGVFLKDHGLVDKVPEVTSSLHPEFVQALKQEGIKGAAPQP